jgi:molybdate transport system regulatory protein
MGISYRRAWLLLDSLNKSFDTPATLNSVGGSGGGGAEVTAFGGLLIERYREVERKLNDMAIEDLNDILRRVNRGAVKAPRKGSVSKRLRKGA